MVCDWPDSEQTPLALLKSTCAQAKQGSPSIIKCVRASRFTRMEPLSVLLWAVHTCSGSIL